MEIHFKGMRQKQDDRFCCRIFCERVHWIVNNLILCTTRYWGPTLLGIGVLTLASAGARQQVFVGEFSG